MRLHLYREEATSGDTLTRGSRELAICRLKPFTLHTETLGFWAECTGKYIIFSLEEMMNSSHDQNHNYYNHYQYQHNHNHYQNQYHYTYVKHVCIYYNHYLYQYHFHSYQKTISIITIIIITNVIIIFIIMINISNLIKAIKSVTSS